MLRTLILAALLSVAGVANAGNIGLFGSNSNTAIVNYLTSIGHTVTNYGAAATSAANLAGLDAVIALRSSNETNDLANYVFGGGLLITEWEAAEWALDTANMLNADGGSNLQIGNNTDITITAAGLALGLGTDLPNPYADGPRTEFQWTLTNIGAGVEILGTYGGGTAAQIGGAYGAGYALINSLDWADSFNGGSASATWLRNALNIQPGGPAVPEPTSLALLGLGLIGLRNRARRK